ncbi:uncharacterized protein LOC113750228 [Coffea eugenioides]|uniref:Uncharacterized protein n=1 Tax=Coffea arabica TaxID=13443 RepID=A0A6P6UHM6_COFAR|nr:uncharacterized protein LOC113750228 [Coffea eugenioides]
MSRCFPYPPPGYILSKAGNEALIESIKLQKEWEKTKADRKKEKKREKKEKKKAEEQKARQTKASQFDHDACGGESWENVKGGFLQKERKDDSEQLERSGITEEHEQPVCSQHPSYSSDSTQNSNKRKRHDSPLNGTRVQGNILRIRLPSQKHIQHDSKDRDELLCSSSGRTDIPAEHKDARADPDKSCSTSLGSDLVLHGLPLRSDQGLARGNSCQQPDVTSQEIVHTDSGSKRHRKLKRAVKRYTDLIENWTPPSRLSEHTEIDDEGWLFGSKHAEKQPEKKVRSSSDISCSSSWLLWPRACYLHDADIYALPYTVPF